LKDENEALFSLQCCLLRGLLNSDELEKASQDLEAWLERDSKRYLEEQKKETGARRR